MSDIKYAYPLILNKVASPQYATPTLRRPRLLDWLNDAANCRAVVVAADAGYGKTTLLWQWEQEVDFPCYWYKLDRSDRDWTFHISYLIEAIAKRHPGFGTRAHSMLQQLGGPGSSRPGVAAYLLAEMHERLTEPCTFIIDDWHYVNAVTEVRGLWNQILRDAPPTCRFVFSSRSKPKLQFARFKTHGGYAELGTDDLRFTSDETARLFRDVYDDPLNPEELEQLDGRTEGWPLSLQLVEVSLQEHAQPTDRSSFIHSIPRPGGALFEYLAEEVLEQQDADTRQFLLRTSILEQMTPEVTERLTGVADGRVVLTELEQRGLFTHSLDDQRFRYHNLFRDFLQRRLVADFPLVEVFGLHIHAASYFETTQQWPESIYHYLAARLHKHAARLIARHGEVVAADGRLGVVDRWLQGLPADAVVQNARISLLAGEVAGIRGDWTAARRALRRAREYFARKGDSRMEALACLKLSTVLSNYGDAESAAEVAQAGVALVSADDPVTRLRLEGNLAITMGWLTRSLEAVVLECKRLAADAAERGLEHYAAIAHHNAGAVLLKLGRVDEAIEHLGAATRTWSGAAQSPFADNSDLAIALLARASFAEARRVAEEGLRRTRPWPRPYALARYGHAAVLAAEGRFSDAIRELENATGADALGTARSQWLASLVEYRFLAGSSVEEIGDAAARLSDASTDQRYGVELAAAAAIGRHAEAKRCTGECLSALDVVAAYSKEALTETAARAKIGVLALEHGGPRRATVAWRAARDAQSRGLLRSLRWWFRRYAPHATSALREEDGVRLIATLANADPDGWRRAIVQVLPDVTPSDRALLLSVLATHPDPSTPDLLRGIEGKDVAVVRRTLQLRHAPRLYVRTFGAISVHRGGWTGPSIEVEKRRARALLAVLAAHAEFPLTRDGVIELMWPEADADSGVNNLNQTVFQLRRYFDPQYRAGESPEYIVSTSDEVKLNSALIRTDLAEILRLPTRLASAGQRERPAILHRALNLIQGEFISDLRYENWASRLQLKVHTELRRHLLPFASSPHVSVDLRVRTASVLTTLDEYDEAAVIALANALANAGKRAAAQRVLQDYAARAADELGEPPSPDLFTARDAVRAPSSIDT
jgi:ATP/maltotriose-dependent transcriptional regulator MalT/DNA-binding SARP family transcriptional activator